MGYNHWRYHSPERVEETSPSSLHCGYSGKRRRRRRTSLLRHPSHTYHTRPRTTHIHSDRLRRESTIRMDRWHRRLRIGLNPELVGEGHST